MEWFSRRTSVSGIEISTWLVVLGAITMLVLIYSSMQEAQIAH
jgi:hypothetical protein